MSEERQFPVLLNYQERKMHPECPRSVPWQFVETFREQARANHGQTLERLAERGGLDPCEMWNAAHGHRWSNKVDLAAAIAWMCEASAESTCPKCGSADLDDRGNCYACLEKKSMGGAKCTCPPDGHDPECAVHPGHVE